MTSRAPAARVEALLVAAAAISLPTLSLLPLGGLYLWEKGWLATWTAGSLALVVMGYAINRNLSRGLPSPPDRRADTGVAQPLDEPVTKGAGDAGYAGAEAEAWQAVRDIAARVDLATLNTRSAVIDLGVEVVEQVATRMHAGQSDAVWRFTLPEGLAITERVSRRLAVFVDQNVPFGNRLTLAHILSIYRARGLVDVAERAYDVWRVVRMVNPATAATQEARERLTKAMFSWSREQVMRRLVAAYVEEVGRAAIDLYSGRLRVAKPSAGGVEGVSTSNDRAPGEPQPATGNVRRAVTGIGKVLGSLVRR